MHSGPEHTNRESYGRLGGRGARDGGADGGRVVCASFDRFDGRGDEGADEVNWLSLRKSEGGETRREGQRKRVQRSSRRVVVIGLEMDAWGIFGRIDYCVEVCVDLGCITVVRMHVLERRQAECG
jgi:hypothetical protein